MKCKNCSFVNQSFAYVCSNCGKPQDQFSSNRPIIGMDGLITPAIVDEVPKREEFTSRISRISLRNPNMVATLIMASIIVLAGLFILSSSRNSSLEETDISAPSTVLEAATEDLLPGIENVSGVNVAKSIVQVVAQEDGEECAFGSGTVIINSHYVLTNFHIVESNENCIIDQILVRTVAKVDRAPITTHTARVVAASEESDLAILKISANGSFTGELVPVAIADEVRLGDELIAIGFPAIGGESITVTKGEVSGFTNFGGVRWIKSSIAISGGNSGGGAFNRFGELVGIPTLLGVPGTDETTDCRPDRDTNGDGEVDFEDECVSMGGFINSLSPGSGALSLAKSKGLRP